MSRIVVIGKSGQLARHIARAAGDRDIVFLGRDQLDLSRAATISPALEAANPDIVINAAAYTAVDKAEGEAELAFATNAEGPGEAAKFAASRGIPIVHISTDYVFDGQKPGAYVEADPTAPLGVYGASKLRGEELVRSATAQHIIVRTAWVYGTDGHNFVRTMLRLAKEHDALRVVGDQTGSPTFAADLAKFILRACDVVINAQPGDSAFGTFNFSGGGETSWAEFAEAIFAEAEELGLIESAPAVTAITTAEYPTQAARPANSVLDCSKAGDTFDFPPRDWRIALKDMLSDLKAQTPKQFSETSVTET